MLSLDRGLLIGHVSKKTGLSDRVVHGEIKYISYVNLRATILTVVILVRLMEG